MKWHEYKGKTITVLYEAQRCLHAEECVHGAPAVFQKDARPWVDPDKAEASAIATVIRRCPTGALHYQAGDAALAEHPDASNTATTTPDGPLYMRGNIAVIAEDGKPLLSDTRIAFCRCGASKNKPFCDNSHHAVAFADPGTAAPGESATTEMATSGRLMAVPTVNGPLHLQGQITVRNATNQVIFEGTETWLCRCGSSANKPFCDGSHARVAFKSQ